ncbi:MAG: hypothetical protein LBQ61_04485 [Spirochaetales bacterium]|jgi:hypothetical protein|nr:hypothetical protein [Spirochaetales bacterium]
MELLVNPRGNGACPLCLFNNRCLIQESLGKAAAAIPSGGKLGLVIYNCPKFQENSEE